MRALCADFPGEYWRRLDRERAYPTEFVAALTKAGFLAALIPEQYGGSGLTMTAAAAIMEEIQASGCNGAPCHAQMYTMGTLLRHGSAAQKERYLPGIARGDLRLQAFGVMKCRWSSICTTRSSARLATSSLPPPLPRALQRPACWSPASRTSRSASSSASS